MDAGTLAALGLLGGFLSLDRTALLQTMVSRPLVGATLAGYLMGEPSLGLLSGLFLELLWLMDLPVGGTVPPEESLSGILAGVFAVAAPALWSPEARAACGVLLAVPAGFAGRWADVGVRRWNGGLLAGVLRELEAGRSPALGRAHWLGALRFLVVGFCTTVAGAGAGAWVLGSWAGRAPAHMASALELVALLLPVLGTAAVLAGLGVRRHGALFAGGLAGGLGLGGGTGLGSGPGGGLWRP